MPSFRIAITGGIAEGKSTVLSYCRNAGYSTASADDVGKQVYELPEVQAGLSAIIGKDPPVDRDELRAAIASNPQIRRDVNRLMHWRIMESLAASEAEIIEVPLLVEACLTDQFEKILVVTCGIEEQRLRLAKRAGIASVDAILATQLPTAAKLPFADRIIRTNQPEHYVCSNVLSWVEKVRERY